jgi:pimeloyl-ACP methyl ester carboxylesterase
MGANDPNVGVEQGKKAQEEIAGAKLIILPTGHAAPVELPDRFNSAVMEFLSNIK